MARSILNENPGISFRFPLQAIASPDGQAMMKPITSFFETSSEMNGCRRWTFSNFNFLQQQAHFTNTGNCFELFNHNITDALFRQTVMKQSLIK